MKPTTLLFMELDVHFSAHYSTRKRCVRGRTSFANDISNQHSQIGSGGSHIIRFVRLEFSETKGIQYLNKAIASMDE